MQPIILDMQLTSADFRRWLPGAVAPLLVREDAEGLTAADDGCGRTVTFALQDLPPRRIALLELPVVRVTMTFSGNWSEPAFAAFHQRFERGFQRGGG